MQDQLKYMSSRMVDAIDQCEPSFIKMRRAQIIVYKTGKLTA